MRLIRDIQTRFSNDRVKYAEQLFLDGFMAHQLFQGRHLEHVVYDLYCDVLAKYVFDLVEYVAVIQECELHVFGLGVAVGIDSIAVLNEVIIVEVQRISVAVGDAMSFIVVNDRADGMDAAVPGDDKCLIV